MTDWLSYVWYEFCYWVSVLGTTLWFSLRVEGRRRMPLEGPALLIANHQSFLDPVMIGVASPRHLCYLARKSLFKHRAFALLIGSLHAVPIDQEGLGKEGLQTILKELHKGRAVIVFPEGERTCDGQMHPFKPGIHLLIKRAKCPIILVGLAGGVAAWPRWQRLPIPAPLFLPPNQGTLAVCISPPIPSDQYADVPRQEVLEDLFKRMQEVQTRAEQLRRK